MAKTKTKSKPEGRWSTPDEVQTAAKQTYLDGKDPVTRKDWQYCVNFWAANAAIAEVEVCLIMARIYDCPLSKPEITVIAKFQQNAKKKQGR